MPKIHFKTQKLRKLTTGQIVLSILAPLIIIGAAGTSVYAIGLNGPSCSSGVLCRYNTSDYRAVAPNPVCATNCSNNSQGKGNDKTEFDQPVLQWSDDLDYNFKNGPPVKRAGESINLNLGYNTTDGPGSNNIITWTNIIGGNAVGSMVVSGGYDRECVTGRPAPDVTDPATAYRLKHSPYATSNDFSSCTSTDKSAIWVDRSSDFVGSQHVVRHQLRLNFSSTLSTATTVCLRTHVSIMNPGVSTPPPISNSNNSEYSNLVGLIGIGRGLPDSMCFRVLPLTSSADPVVDATCEAIFGVTGTPGPHYVRIYVNDGNSPGNLENPANFEEGADYSSFHNSSEEFELNLMATHKIATSGKPLLWSVYVWNNATGTGGASFGQSGQIDNCFTAICTINDFSNVPNAPPNSHAVKAGQPFYPVVTVINTGSNDLPSGIPPDHHLSATIPGGTTFGFNSFPMGTSIPRGGSASRVVQLTAPGGKTSTNLSFYADFIGYVGLGPWCSAPVNSYERYDFTVNASSTWRPDDELRDSVDFTSKIKQVGASDVNSPLRRSFLKQPPGGAPPIPVTNFGPLTTNDRFLTKDVIDNYRPASNKLEDNYCLVVVLDRAHGWRGPNENYIDNQSEGATNCSQFPPCNPKTTVCCPPPGQSTAKCNKDKEPDPGKDLPYVRVYGNDVSVGGGFAPNCPTNSTGGIFTYMRPISDQKPGGNSGSGAQLAAMALGKIEGFTSASLRALPGTTKPPYLPNGLTFANKGVTPATDSRSPYLGGELSDDGRCAPDYFGETQYPVENTSKITRISAPSLDLSTVDNDKQTLFSNGIDVTLTGQTSFNKHHTVYVDGNVFITSDIAYKTDAYGSLIPSFALVVKGNIYIKNTVHQLDGLYVAQPTTNPDGSEIANTGNIYTCATGFGVLSSNELFNNCGAKEFAATDCDKAAAFRQLLINGAFIANRVILNRSVYSLRCSTYLEQVNISKAAEVFNFSPEMYLSPPVFSPRSTSTSGEYDYITTLPPTL